MTQHEKSEKPLALSTNPEAGASLSPEAGASMVEYTIAISAILLVCITVVATIGTTLADRYTNFAPQLFG